MSPSEIPGKPRRPRSSDERERERNPFFTPPKNPNYLRRARFHDYTLPGKYMLTLYKHPDLPPYSTIDGDPRRKGTTTPAAIERNDPAFLPPHTRLHPEGKIIPEALKAWAARYPCIKLAEHVVMPDHVHVCLRVTHKMEIDLSTCVSKFMGECTRRLRQLTGNPEATCFAPGFNDKIAFTDEQYLTQRRYVRENPRRYMIRRLHPELFYSRSELLVEGKTYHAIGNIHLLHHPQRVAVRFSRRYASAEMERLYAQWMHCAENSGVLVSPFIHPVEKEALHEGLDLGASVIKIMENGIPPRLHPKGKYFDLCAAGRLLLIAPAEYTTRPDDLTYARAQQLNALAAAIAQTEYRGRIIR